MEALLGWMLIAWYLPQLVFWTSPIWVPVVAFRLWESRHER